MLKCILSFVAGLVVAWVAVAIEPLVGGIGLPAPSVPRTQPEKPDMKLWTNSSGQLIVDATGKPIDCETCPCDEGAPEAGCVNCDQVLDDQAPLVFLGVLSGVADGLCNQSEVYNATHELEWDTFGCDWTIMLADQTTGEGCSSEFIHGINANIAYDAGDNDTTVTVTCGPFYDGSGGGPGNSTTVTFQKVFAGELDAFALDGEAIPLVDEGGTVFFDCSGASFTLTSGPGKELCN